jgi:hypothetical protein
MFSIAGSIAHHSRRTWLHLATQAPHVNLVTTGLTDCKDSRKSPDQAKHPSPAA